MTFTPDARPFCGKMPDIEGLFHSAGFSGHGIVQSPAIGLIMSQLILDGTSSYDVTSIEADRYFDMPGYLERGDIEAQCVAMAGNYYGKVERPEAVAGGAIVDMKILVPTKRVPDTDQKIVATADGGSVAVDHIALRDQSVRRDRLGRGGPYQRATGDDTVEVVAVGIGGAVTSSSCDTALAMGAARGHPRQRATARLDPWNVARLLRAVVEREQPDLVLMGKQAVDDDANQTGQFLAALLDWPQATFASRLELLGGRDSRSIAKRITVSRRFVLPLPAVVTADLRLNEPRYASLAGIMKAKKKPLDVLPRRSLA